MKKVLVLLFICVSCFALKAQSRVAVGWLPEISVSHRWSDKWRLTGQLESMQRMWQKDEGGLLVYDYRYVRTDATLALSYRLDPSWSLAVGNLARFTGDDFVYRTLQQISYSTRGQLRLGHRLRTDQTFAPDQNTRYRFRYRFSMEVPLKGESLNDKEWYLISSVEQLLGLQDAKWQWEQRLSTGFGYYINGKNKIEIGFDYRLDDFIDTNGRHLVWTTLNYFVNL